MKKYLFYALSIVIGVGVGITMAVTTHQSNQLNEPAIKPLVVEHVWRMGQVQLGIDLLYYGSATVPLNQVRYEATEAVNYIVDQHANSVGISFPFYTSGPKANSVYAGQGTPSPAQITQVVEVAKKAKLRVTLRPLLDESDLRPKDWRGSIGPTNTNEWFANYSRFLKPYLKVAQTTGASTFIVGAELSSIESQRQWVGLLRSARLFFHRQLGYSQNYDSFHSDKATPPVDVLGVDYYAPMPLGDNASVAQLVRAMNNWWESVPRRIHIHQVVIDEVGLAAQNGAYKVPYSTNLQTPTNLNVQARWFTAICDVAKTQRLSGLYFWNVPFGGNLSVGSGEAVSIIGRPSSEAIRNCFEKFSS